MTKAFLFWKSRHYSIFSSAVISAFLIALNFGILSLFLRGGFFRLMLITVIGCTAINYVLSLFLSREVKSLHFFHCLADAGFPIGVGLTTFCVFTCPQAVAAAAMVFLVIAAVMLLKYLSVRGSIPKRRRPYAAIYIKAAFCISTWLPFIFSIAYQ